ncbi:MAG: PD-(D/E)XK motif protein, partial [Thermoanaerobaculia bacterium]
MEEEAAQRDDARWLTRFALPEPGRVLLVALETGTGTRALLLPLPKTDIPRKREWPDSEGLEVFGLSLEGQSHLGVRLKARSYADVFCVLAEDVARHIAHAPDSHTAASAMLARIGRWRKFLAAAASGLSTERIRGLVGELTFLRRHLLGSTDPTKALASWRAPLRAHQDFQAMGSAIEVKATTAKQPQLI